MSKTSSMHGTPDTTFPGPSGDGGGDDNILTSREARDLLRIGRTKLHELTRRQRIPAYRIGDGRTSALRYRRSDLLRWLFSQKI